MLQKYNLKIEASVTRCKNSNNCEYIRPPPSLPRETGSPGDPARSCRASQFKFLFASFFWRRSLGFHLCLPNTGGAYVTTYVPADYPPFRPEMVTCGINQNWPQGCLYWLEHAITGQEGRGEWGNLTRAVKWPQHLFGIWHSENAIPQVCSHLPLLELTLRKILKLCPSQFH